MAAKALKLCRRNLNVDVLKTANSCFIDTYFHTATTWSTCIMLNLYAEEIKYEWTIGFTKQKQLLRSWLFRDLKYKCTTKNLDLYTYIFGHQNRASAVVLVRSHFSACFKRQISCLTGLIWIIWALDALMILL